MYIISLGHRQVIRTDEAAGINTYRLGLPYSAAQVDVNMENGLIDLAVSGKVIAYGYFDTEQERKWFLTTFLYGWADGGHEGLDILFNDCLKECRKFFKNLDQEP